MNYQNGQSNLIYDLADRFVAFVAKAVRLCNHLPNDMTGQYYGNQLLRSGGRAALNYGGAQGAQSSKDYIYKSSLSIKELKESRVILKMLKAVAYGDHSTILNLQEESEQLVKIMAPITKNNKPKAEKNHTK